MKKPWLVMTAIGSVILSFVIFSWYFLFYSKTYFGVSVAGIDLSSRSQNEVICLLSPLKESYRHKKNTFYYDDMTFVVENQSIDFEIDLVGTVDDVWNYGRKGPWWDRIKKQYIAWYYGYEIPLKTTYDEVKLSQLVLEWESQIGRPPRNATLSIANGKMIIEEPGRKLVAEKLPPLLLNAFLKLEDEVIALPVITLYPEITTAKLGNSGIRVVVSRYSSLFNSQETNRSVNIKVAAEKINGYILYPGKIFSFNDIVGPRETNYGFKEALEIMDGEMVLGVGGGVCQLSSTLYNAALLANLEIIERYNHSKPLSYVPLGRDATVVFNSLDFKFINNTSNAIMIIAEVENNKLLVGILGQHSLVESVEILSVDQEVIPQGIVKKNDESLYLGEFKIERQGKPGGSVTTLRIIRSDGQEVKREILSRDRYLPEDTILKVGIKMPQF